MKKKCPHCNSTKFKKNLDNNSWVCSRCGYINDLNKLPQFVTWEKKN